MSLLIQATRAIMSGIRLHEVIKPFNGDGDFSIWLKKVKMVLTMQKVKDIVMVLPMFLEGPAFSVYEHLNEDIKGNINLLERSLLDAFSISSFEAYERFRERNWIAGEPVDVFLSDLRRLAGLFDMDREEVLRVAFVCGLPSDVSSQIKATADILQTPLSAIVQQARALMANRISGTNLLTVRQTDFGKKSTLIKCFRCDGNHIARNCPHIKCFKCGVEGHVSSNCLKVNERSFAPTFSRK